MSRSHLFFSTAASLLALPEVTEVTKHWTSTCKLELFSTLFLAEFTFKCIFSEAGVHTVTGYATTDQGSSKEHAPYLLQSTYYYSFPISPISSCTIEKAMLQSDQKHSYVATRVNIALHFSTLKLHAASRKDSSLPKQYDCVNTQHSNSRAQNLSPFSSKWYVAFNILLDFSTQQHRQQDPAL